jgi:hypothetical protein
MEIVLRGVARARHDGADRDESTALRLYSPSLPNLSYQFVSLLAPSWVIG